MAREWSKEVGLLRSIAAHLELRPLPIGFVTQDFLISERLTHVRERADGIVALSAAGHVPFSGLLDCMCHALPNVARGLNASELEDKLFEGIEDLLGRPANGIDEEDVKKLIEKVEIWFSKHAVPRRVFVPCVLSRTQAPSFCVGPVTFSHIDDIPQSDFYVRVDDSVSSGRLGFDRMLRWMRDSDSHWLARVSTEGCSLKRAEEIAELAVDLTIVAFQLAAPFLDTRTMARLDAQRGASRKETLSEADGYYNVGWSLKEPGMSIGQGTMPHILNTAASVFLSVGNLVQSFSTGLYRLPELEKSWCDAAYWYHQAIVETLDTIAIAKLETSLEVMLRSGSSKGSKQRVLQILDAFFKLQPKDPVAVGSLISAEQYAKSIVQHRSRVLHGTWSTLDVRNVDRSGMETFVRGVLRRAVIELNDYCAVPDAPDDMLSFLDWVRNR